VPWHAQHINESETHDHPSRTLNPLSQCRVWRREPITPSWFSRTWRRRGRHRDRQYLRLRGASPAPFCEHGRHRLRRSTRSNVRRSNIRGARNITDRADHGRASKFITNADLPATLRLALAFVYCRAFCHALAALEFQDDTSKNSTLDARSIRIEQEVPQENVAAGSAWGRYGGFIASNFFPDDTFVYADLTCAPRARKVNRSLICSSWLLRASPPISRSIRSERWHRTPASLKDHALECSTHGRYPPARKRGAQLGELLDTGAAEAQPGR